MRNWGEIEGRLDSFFYKKDFLDLENQIKCITKYKLRDFILKISSGATPKTTESEKYYTDRTGVKFLRVQNLSPEGLKLDDCKFINELTHNNMLARSKVHENNLLVKITGVGRMAISCVAPENFEANINQHMVVIKTESSQISKLIATFLNSDIGEKLASRRSTGGTRPALDYTALRSIPIILNESIIKIMDDAYTQKQAKENEATQLLDSINTYLLDELGIKMPIEEDNILDNRKFCVSSSNVIGKRFDPFYHQNRFEIYNKVISDGLYGVQKLGDFISTICYGASVENCYVDKGIPLLRIKDLLPNEIISDDIVYLPMEMEKQLKSSRVQFKDILISRSGTIGVASVVDDIHSGYAFGSFMIKFSVVGINPKYVTYIINSSIGKIYFEKNKIGAIQGNITIPTIKSLILPVPLPEKQDLIVFEIESIRKKAKTLQNEAQTILEKAKKEVEIILLGGENK